jgi:hypothetical protein
MKCTLQYTELAGRNALVNTMTVWLAFPLAGMKVNGYNAQQVAAVNCAGFQTPLAHAIVTDTQAQSPFCYNALRHHCNALLHEYLQHVVTV